jgi:hypothetical protein
MSSNCLFSNPFQYPEISTNVLQVNLFLTSLIFVSRAFSKPGPMSRIANVALQMNLFLDSLKFVSWPVESRATPNDWHSDHQDCAASDFVSPLTDIRLSGIFKTRINVQRSPTLHFK